MVEISGKVFSETFKDDLNEFMEIRIDRVFPETMSKMYVQASKEEDVVMEKVKSIVPRETWFDLDVVISTLKAASLECGYRCGFADGMEITKVL